MKSLLFLLLVSGVLFSHEADSVSLHTGRIRETDAGKQLAQTESSAAMEIPAMIKLILIMIFKQPKVTYYAGESKDTQDTITITDDSDTKYKRVHVDGKSHHHHHRNHDDEDDDS